MAQDIKHYKMRVGFVAKPKGMLGVDLEITASEKEHFEIALNDEDYIFIEVKDVTGNSNWLRVDKIVGVFFEEIK